MAEQIELTIDKNGIRIASCLCTFYFNGLADVLIVDDVFVAPTMRHRGYGKKLMEKVVEIGKKKKVDSIELNVNKTNAVAIKLYEGVGFELTDKYYYRLLMK